MKPVIVAAATLLTLSLAEPAAAALPVGATAPALSVPGAQGDKIIEVDLAALLKQGPVVIYFFPSAFIDGAESKAFADSLEQFRAAGATVLGSSKDTTEALAKLSTEVCGGKFPMAAADQGIIDSFDVNDGAQFVTRTTYVIAPSGMVAFVHEGEDIATHVRSALAFVQQLQKGAATAPPRGLP